MRNFQLSAPKQKKSKKVINQLTTWKRSEYLTQHKFQLLMQLLVRTWMKPSKVDPFPAAFMGQLLRRLNYLFVTFPALKEQRGDLVCCFCEWYLKLLFITLTQFTL